MVIENTKHMLIVNFLIVTNHPIQGFSVCSMFSKVKDFYFALQAGEKKHYLKIHTRL